MENRQIRKSAAAVGALLVLLLLAIWVPWGGADPDEIPAEAESVKDVGDQLESGAAKDVAETTSEARTKVEAAVVEAEVVAATLPYEFEMEIVARTVEDLVGSGVPIHLAPEFHVLNQTRTDANGVARVKWRGRVKTMTMVFGSTKGLMGGQRLHRCVAHSGEVTRAVLYVKSVSTSPGTFAVFGKGGQLKFHAVALSGGTHRIRGLTRLVSSGPLPLYRDKDGWAWFSTGRDNLQTPSVRNSTTIRGNQVFLSNIEFVIGQPQTKKVNRKRVLTGVVRDAAGRPVRGALVRLAGKWRMHTNHKGEYRIEFKRRDGEVLDVRAGGGDRGLAFGKIELGEETETSWDANLDRGTELRGQLLSTDGKARAGWHVQIEPEDGSPWVDGTTTDKEGRFAIPNVEDRAYRLRAFAPKQVLPSFQERDVRPIADNLFAVWAGSKPGTLKVTPRDVEDKPVAAALRMWADRSGIGRRVHPLGKGSSVVAGNYRFVIEAAGFGVKEHAPVQISAEQQTDLGDVLLGERASLDMSKVKKGLTLYRMHPAVLSRVETLNKKRVWLPPGDYRAFLGRDEIDFEIKPGPNEVPPAIRR